MTKRKLFGMMACVLALGTAGAAAVSMTKNGNVQTTGAPVTEVIVTAQSPHTGDIAMQEEFAGSIHPDESVEVFPKISGDILKAYFQVGDRVEAGQLLFEIDSTDLQISYNASVAQIEASRIQADQKLGSGYDSNLISLKSQLDSTQAALNSARSNLKNLNDDADDDLLNAQKAEDKYLAAMKAADADKAQHEPGSEDYKKAEQEYQNAKLSYDLAHAQVKDLDDDDDPTLRSARTSYRNAQIAYNAAKEAYDQAAGISRKDTEKTVEADLRASELKLESQAKQLEYAKVYAPISGVIEEKDVEDFGKASPQSAAYIISNKELMVAEFSVSEEVADTLEIGQTVEVEKADRTTTGTISEIGTLADSVSGLYTVKATVEDPAFATRSGSIAKIHVNTQKADGTVLLPVDCIYFSKGDAYVYCYKDGTAVKTPVEIGISNGTETQILSGLSASDVVINTWHPRLLDGASVTLKSDIQSTSAANSPLKVKEPNQSNGNQGE